MVTINIDSALKDVAFLANSENRVAVFEALADGPRSRAELRTEVDASRVTIARILRELEDRYWISQTNQSYEITPTGEWICAEFLDLVTEMLAEQRLRDPMRWFPADLVSFDVQCLRDAELVLLDGSDSTALVRRILEFHRSGDRIRGVARSAAPVFVENQWELSVEGDTTVDLVVTPGAMEVVRNHPPTAALFHELLDHENAHYAVNPDIPLSVGIVNDRVGITLTDDDGIHKAGIVSDHDAVYEWAVDLYECCREAATPVEPDAIPV